MFQSFDFLNICCCMVMLKYICKFRITLLTNSTCQFSQMEQIFSYRSLKSFIFSFFLHFMHMCCCWKTDMTELAPYCCLLQIEQDFINYNFLYTRFCACKTISSAHPCTWEIVHVKKQTCTLLIIWYGNRNCTKLKLYCC